MLSPKSAGFEGSQHSVGAWQLGEAALPSPDDQLRAEQRLGQESCAGELGVTKAAGMAAEVDEGCTCWLHQSPGALWGAQAVPP